jgi:hypothetical protein
MWQKLLLWPILATIWSKNVQLSRFSSFGQAKPCSNGHIPIRATNPFKNVAKNNSTS